MKEIEQPLECPVCGRTFAVEEIEPGHDWTCPACGRTFAVQEDDVRPDTENDELNEVSETREKTSSQGDGPDSDERTRRDAPFREKTKKRPLAAKTAAIRAFQYAKTAFLRMPERLQGAALASVVFLFGIALFSGNSPKKNDLKQEPRPNVVPLETDKNASQWILSCVETDFQDVMRFPEQHIGKDCFIQGEICSVRYPAPEAKNHRGVLRVWQNGKHGGDINKEWYVVFDDERTSLPQGNLLKKDCVTIFGTFEKIHEWTGTNAFNRPISGKAPLIVARLIAHGDAESVIKNYRQDVFADKNQASSTEKTQARKSSGNGSATPEELCEEFASGGSHFVRKSATTVWWDVGGETPRFTCEVSFLPGGKARLTQDNTFYAYEEKNRSTSPQVLARRLQAAYDRYQGGSSEIKNVRATVSSDGRLLFSGEISVERGNVSKQIGKVFSALNEARLASRLN